jgi:hypothetical protein
MFRLAVGTSLGIVLALAGGANAWPAPTSGVYSNVCLYPETDDLGGFALQIVLDAPAAGVFWLCEGGCGWPEPMTSIRRSGDRIRFTVAEHAVESSTGKTVQIAVYHYRGKFTARGLMLTSDAPDFGRANLIRLPAEKPVLARSPEAGRNDVSTPKPIRRCR